MKWQWFVMYSESGILSVCGFFLVGRELTAQIAENQQNLGDMDHLLKMKEDLEERVESLEKELSRKDRDMEVRSKTLHCVFLIMMCMFF